jgi:hypothetical protein
MSKIEDEVCKKIQARAEQAREKKPCPNCGHAELKYDNKTMDRTDLSLVEWLTHHQEELMDASVYAEKLILIVSKLKEMGVDFDTEFSQESD